MFYDPLMLLEAYRRMRAIREFEERMLGANAIVGAAPPIAVGAALTHKTLGTGGVSMAFIGAVGAESRAVLDAFAGEDRARHPRDTVSLERGTRGLRHHGGRRRWVPASNLKEQS